MTSRTTRAFLVLALTLGASIYINAQSSPKASASGTWLPASAGRKAIAHGEYLVKTMGCHDCHTPLKMGPKGPEPDMTRALTGHPSTLVLPPAPNNGPGPWQFTAAETMTAWAGPWGVSYTANLTPDKETGLGDWTFDMFAATMKTGRHQGKGRPLLPPMPWQVVGALTETDMRDLFAYLQSLKPVHNKVPTPIDPEEKQEER